MDTPDAAFNRGLYRRAALLWKHAITTSGSAMAASRLIFLLSELDWGASHHPAHWIADHSALDDPERLTGLLGALRDARGAGAVATLAARAAGDASLDDPGGVAELLWALRKAGEAGPVSTLAARAANAGLWRWTFYDAPGKGRQYKFGREPDGAASAPWGWQDLAD